MRQEVTCPTGAVDSQLQSEMYNDVAPAVAGLSRGSYDG